MGILDAGPDGVPHIIGGDGKRSRQTDIHETDARTDTSGHGGRINVGIVGRSYGDGFVGRHTLPFCKLAVANDRLNRAVNGVENDGTDVGRVDRHRASSDGDRHSSCDHINVRLIPGLDNDRTG